MALRRARRPCCKSAHPFRGVPTQDLAFTDLSCSVFIMSYLGLFMETYKLSQSWFYIGEVVYMLW